MKQSYFKSLFASVCVTLMLSFAFVNDVNASHAMGADLSYECIDPVNRVYKITLRFYRDCAGIDAPLSVTVNVGAPSCGQALSLTLSQEPCPPSTNGGQPCEVSPLCPSSILQSSCNGGNLPGVQAFTYSGIITLPADCPDWTFSFSECCRNDQITNLLNASSEDLYVEATLNNSGGNQNNSPVFTTLPVPFICANQPFSYNQGAVDVDGDSVVYSLVNALGAGASAITYNGGFSPTNPLTTTPPNSFGFSNTTGQISFQPNGVQVAVVTVLVQEYRNGVLIGSTMRDIQIVVLNIPGCGIPPTFSGAIQPTVQNGFYISPQLVQVCPGNVLSFSVLAVNSTNDSVFIESNASIAMPGSQFVISYASSDSVYGYFSWTPTALDTGFNNLIVTVKNKNCPIASIQSYAVSVQVLAGTYAGPDLAYCPAGGPVQLQAYGGNQFTWTPSTNLSNPNVGNPLASPSQTTDYIVVSNLSSSCKNRDTVRVNVVPDFNFIATQSDDTICRFEFVNLTVNPDAAFAPYTYAWAPATSLNAATISNPAAQPDFTTNYVVTITASNGCVRKDTLRVVVEGQGPQVVVTADRNKVCIGDTIHLTSKISTLPCGLNVVPCQGNYNIKTVGTGVVQDVNGATPYRGFYEDARMQILYRASELQALGMQAGSITDIAFNIAQQGSTSPYNGFTIRMGCTNLNALSTFVPGLSTVYGPTQFTPNGTGFNTHTFDTPYDWDGFSNLIIEVCFDNAAYTSDDIVNATTTAYNSVLFAYQDNTVGCNLALPNISTNRPNTQFIYCTEATPNITYTWTPTTNLYVPDSLNPFVVLNQSTTYYLNVNDGSCTGGGSVTLNIDTAFGITAGPDVSFCNGVPAQLNGAVTGTPPTGGTSACGVNGTPCSTSPVVKTFTPAGTSSSSITPFMGGFFLTLEDQRSQILYRAVDLLAAGITPGTFNQFGLNISAKGSAFPYQNLSIKLGCTNKTELTAGTWEPTTTVYTNLLYPTVAGWNDFPLANTFDWDGVSNIVVEICWDNPDGFPSTGLDAVNAGTPTYNSFQTITGALAVGCNMPATQASVAQVLPEMRLRLCGSAVLPVTYNWSPSGGLSSNTIATPYATPTQQTTYVLTAYFGGKCPKTDTVTVTPQTFSYSVSPDTAVCEGDSVQLSVNGGSAYTWIPSTGLSCANCPNPVAKPTDSTVYYLTITDTITGCIVKDTLSLLVFNLTADAWFADTLVDQGTPLTLGANVSGNSTVGYTYLWTPSDYLDNPALASPVSAPLSDVLYLLTVNAGGCADTALINVRVNLVESPVVVPNAFTPNGDGKNDAFFPVILNELSKVKTFRVYNRYGALIHNSNNPWDGTFKGASQPVGTYLYYIVIERPLKEDEPLQGSFSLLR